MIGERAEKTSLDIWGNIDDPRSMNDGLTSAGIARMEFPSGGTGWIVTKYNTARQLLGDTRLSTDPSLMGDKAPSAALADDARQIIDRDMLTQDPPVHTRLRHLVAPSFSKRAITALRPMIESVAGKLAEELRDRGKVDLMADFAAPLPTLVLAEIFGIPNEDCAQVRHWSDMFAASLVPVTDMLRQSIIWLNDYATDLARRKRAAPDDSLTAVLTAGLDDDNVGSMVCLMLVAGQTATTQLIAKGLRLLITHEDVHARVRADRSTLSSIVDEVLRYETPLAFSVMRMAIESISVGDVVIAAGDLVLFSFADVNLDSDRFACPDRFDPSRQENNHLAFGYGIHRCLGASLAKAEAEIAFGVLMDRFVRIDLAVSAGDPSLANVRIMTQLTELPVRSIARKIP